MHLIFFYTQPRLTIQQVDTYGTSSKTSEELVEIINKNFDLRPGIIVKELDLAKPIYFQTAKNGKSLQLPVFGQVPDFRRRSFYEPELLLGEA